MRYEPVHPDKKKSIVNIFYVNFDAYFTLTEHVPAPAATADTIRGRLRHTQPWVVVVAAAGA